MFALLLGAGVIYLVLGDLTEALMLLVFATISVSITVVQELRSERVLEALRDMTSPRALVIRDGVRRRIPGREVVRGDAVVLLEGDRVPADAVLAAASNLLVDESLLTGESVPVRKSAGDGDAPHGPARRRGSALRVFRHAGRCAARASPSCGRPARRARSARSARRWAGSTPSRRACSSRHVGWSAISPWSAWPPACSPSCSTASCAATGCEAILGGIALGMSMLPEEFPLVLTAFMVMGAWRLSRARVLTRRAAAIEMLGSATVLCTDKTGTLTENRMTIAELRTPATPGDHGPACRDGLAGQRPGVVRSDGAGDQRRGGDKRPEARKASTPAESWSGSTACGPGFSP